MGTLQILDGKPFTTTFICEGCGHLKEAHPKLVVPDGNGFHALYAARAESCDLCGGRLVALFMALDGKPVYGPLYDARGPHASGWSYAARTGEHSPG